jgi:DNA-formamidopyrimidine glycosylase
MPEIGECYSISESIPIIGKVKKVFISDKAKKYILKGADDFKSVLEGCEMLNPFSYGKSVLFPLILKNKKAILCSQLGMTGSWFLNNNYAERGSDHLIIESDSIKLRYSDPRMFGKMRLYFGDDFSEILKSIIIDKKWGIDPIQASVKEIQSQLLKLKKNKVSIKVKLLEQNLIFGIGNYLASEVLFDSKISPLRKCSSLSEEEYLELSKSIKKICLLTKKKKGFSFAGGYILPDGSLGNMKDFIQIYGKTKCLKCSAKVTSKFLNQRVTYFCKKCQN